MNRILAIALGSALLLGTASLTFAQEEKKEPLRQQRKGKPAESVSPRAFKVEASTPKDRRASSKIRKPTSTSRLKEMKTDGPPHPQGEALKSTKSRTRSARTSNKQKHDAQTARNSSRPCTERGSVSASWLGPHFAKTQSAWRQPWWQDLPNAKKQVRFRTCFSLRFCSSEPKVFLKLTSLVPRRSYCHRLASSHTLVLRAVRQ